MGINSTRQTGHTVASLSADANPLGVDITITYEKVEASDAGGDDEWGRALVEATGGGEFIGWAGDVNVWSWTKDQALMLDHRDMVREVVRIRAERLTDLDRIASHRSDGDLFEMVI